MTLVPLQHVTILGMHDHKDMLLDELHVLGCMELIPLKQASSMAAGAEVSDESLAALQFLLACPLRRSQVSDETNFDALHVQQRSLELKGHIAELEAQRDDLLQRLDAARPWGNFHFVPLAQMGGMRLWFYVVPHLEMSKVQALDVPWETVARDVKFCYITVVSEDEPAGVPGVRAHIGSLSPTELSRKLEDVELAIEDAQAERAFLTRWCLLFANNLSHLQNLADRNAAAQQTCDLAPLFALEGWVSSERVAELRQYSERNRLVFQSRPPQADESPPSLMRNTANFQAGEDLVNFYMTPGYWTWDPSGIVAVSFAIFFAMILADAGYAVVLGLGLALIWRKLGRSAGGQRFRPLLSMIVAFSLIYGVLAGSYFGLTPSQGSLLAKFHVFDFRNSKLMMGISVLVGGLHIVMANVMDARRYADWRDGLGSIGWAMAVAGGLVLAGGTLSPDWAVLKYVGGLAFVVGLVLVVAFTARHEKPIKRFSQGLLGLTKVSAAFGDVLSYLRLFALGLASGSLAMAFNDMATGIYSSMPRFGFVLSLLVLLFGHVLNLLLGVSSGVIHGLRLNVIEFFNWGLKDEGRRFTPFRRKEPSLWI